MERYRDREKSRGGFTLIEVLLVVVIIGILVGVAVPRFSGKVKKAQISKAKADVQNIGMALRMFEVDNGTYPASLEALTTKPANAANWDGPYLEQGLPKDPWGGAYSYQMPGSRNPHSYDLSSAGPPGGEPIGNWQDTP